MTSRRYLAANTHGQFVKTSGGKPACYATWNRSEAHVFDSSEEALQWVGIQFRGKGQVVTVSPIREFVMETEGTGLVHVSIPKSQRRCDNDKFQDDSYDEDGKLLPW